MTGRPLVLCVGRLYCDLIFTDLPRMPTMGTEIYAGGFGVHAGGGAFITAAHLASLGHGATLSAMLPPQPFGGLLADDLARAGVDLGLCHTQPVGDEPQVTVALVEGDDRAFVTRRTGPAFPPLEARDLTGIGATHLHIGELATLIERPEIVPVARSAGATISLDCSWDDGLAASDIGDAIAGVDVFLPNEAEIQHLIDIGVPLSHVPLTAIKQGSAGSTALIQGKRIHAAAEPVTVVDTTGAGDAFNAGFVSAWLAGEGLQTCLRAGNAQGARAVAQRGGFHAGPPSPKVSEPPVS